MMFFPIEEYVSLYWQRAIEPHRGEDVIVRNAWNSCSLVLGLESGLGLLYVVLPKGVMTIIRVRGVRARIYHVYLTP